MTLTRLSQGEPWRIALPHIRPNPLLIWLTRGEARVLLGGRRVGVTPGAVCVIPAGHLMGFELSTRAHGAALMPDISVVAGQPNAARVLRGVSPAMVDALANMEYAEQIAGWLAEHDRTADAKPVKASDALMLGLFGRLTLPQPAAFGVADHATALGVTPTHLTRVCRSSLGQSAAGLMTGRVLHAARIALQDSEAPIKDIATQIGFSSAAYFTRFVDKHTGLTPSALRRMYRRAA